MIELLKNVYLLDIKAIKNEIEHLWTRYQKIINNKKSSWEDLNEARAILYSLGRLYPEGIVSESLEKRVKYIKPRISLDNFLTAIDRNDAKIFKKYANNEKFNKLKELYLITKGIKNRVKNNIYLDEERFNDAYAKLEPKNYW